ncbi:MAG: CPBP family intramembrane metalloprotease [Lachnospiraceae bacterium]|nr:CPBP family intramembrane metalloprotease [Lachnospiraceae bacterium]
MGIGDGSNQQALDEAVIRYGALHIITIAVIGPIVEEIFYRGILFGFLKGRGKSIVRSIAAILLSSMIFAFSHTSIIDFGVTDLLANIPILMLGLTVTTLYWRTDNIFCPIIVHIVINTIGTLG